MRYGEQSTHISHRLYFSYQIHIPSDKVETPMLLVLLKVYRCFAIIVHPRTPNMDPLSGDATMRLQRCRRIKFCYCSFITVVEVNLVYLPTIPE